VAEVTVALGPFRPPALVAATDPAPAERCTTCLGRWWWTEREAPRREWHCWCCVPAPVGVGVRDVSGRLVPRETPTGGIAGRLSGRLLDLADQVRRLDPPGHRDPEAFHVTKSGIADELRRVARDAQRRLLD
jgi:hypothetical protein